LLEAVSGCEPSKRESIIDELLAAGANQWQLAGIGFHEGKREKLFGPNSLVHQALAKDLANGWYGIEVPRVIDIDLGSVRTVPILGKRFELLAPPFYRGAYLVLYTYYADVRWEGQVFTFVTAVALLFSMLTLYLSLLFLVRGAARDLVGYSRDLEERNVELQATKEHLLHSSKLAMLGELAASVAHEIRNPLASIASGLQVAQDRAAPDDEELQPVLARVMSDIERLRKILTGMVKFSRPGGNVYVYDLNSVVEKVLLLLKKKAKDQGVLIERRLEEGLPELQGDAAQIEQVVLNLVLNAVQARPEGGKVRVLTASDSERVWLEVRDDGEGVPPEMLARLFTPFLTSKGEDGSGLGLSISKGIVESHAGVLSLENTDPGALARVVLPRSYTGQTKVES